MCRQFDCALVPVEPASCASLFGDALSLFGSDRMWQDRSTRCCQEGGSRRKQRSLLSVGFSVHCLGSVVSLL